MKTCPKRRWRILAVFLLAALQTASAAAQDVPRQVLRVFIDCQSIYCDFDYFRREIRFVDYMRDREDADVHVLVTTQPTGGGGVEFTVQFVGLRQYAGHTQELVHVSRFDDTRDVIRSALARIKKAGLLPFVVGTSAFDRIAISYEDPALEEAAPVRQHDPWNYWIFRTRLSGFFRAEQRQDFANVAGTVTANRTTDDWKFNLAVNGRFSESNFSISETQTVTNRQRNYGVDGLLVRSLSAHWSAGGRVSASVSTFLNYNLAVRATPALEFNLFPYAESTRRQLRFLYGVGLSSFNYEERTIFDRTSETRPNHSLTATLDVRQLWGSVSLSAEGFHYLDDPTQNRLELFSNLDVRIFRGLSVNLFGRIAFIRDQLYLPAAGASRDDILLQRRRLRTNYEYFVSTGITYTFGSIYNNVVNPRFGGSGGGVVVF